MLAFLLAAALQEPAPQELPDPVAFVEFLLTELDPVGVELRRNCLKILDAEEQPGAGGVDMFLRDPGFDQPIAQFRRIWDAHADPLLPVPSEHAFRYWAGGVTIFTQMPAETGLYKLRKLRQDAEALHFSGHVVRLEIDLHLGTLLKQDQPFGVCSIWLRQSQGRWLLSGFKNGAVDRPPLPSCPHAKAWQRDGSSEASLVVHRLPADEAGNEPRVVPSLDFRFDADLEAPGNATGAERLRLELKENLPSGFRCARAAGRATLVVAAPPEVGLAVLAPLLPFAADETQGVVRLAIQVDLDSTRRPGRILLEQSAARDSSNPWVDAGSDPAGWPADLKAPAQAPTAVGIALTPGRSMADLAATADAQIALGVTTLFLAEPDAAPR